MNIPADNPLTVEGIELGRFLFWEKDLSEDFSMNCASCHLPEASFSDPEQFSTGVTGAVGTRQSMALVNIGWSTQFFWDGRAMTLEEQIIDPIPNPIEMNLPWPEALDRLRANELYPPMFKEAFGSETIDQDRVTKAIAQFLRTMNSYNSKYDQWKRGEVQFLSDSEFRGYELFIKEGGDPEIVENGEFGADCFHCHSEAGLQLSDYLPHNNGLDSIFTDLGYGGVNGNPLDNGKFKTPTLRNVALTAPYMHDGRFETLEEVVDHYDSGGLPSETIDSFMKYTDGGLMLSEVDKIDLINFLHTLTDTSFINNPAFSNPHVE
ncbi:MAG: cytochrome-c peroxidase [Flavobacteriales bacterium]|nr:cytochrome-c peroxidase [Flavobacteriales bacterium]